MCEPATIIAIGAGTATAAGGMMQARAKHNAAKAAAQRQNQINQLKYIQDRQKTYAADQAKANQFKRQLEAHAAAQTALYKQMEINQMERTRTSMVAQQQLEEKISENAFEGQSQLIASIQAQGTVLAGSQQSGQSLLLSLMDVEKQLGIQEAQLDASIRDANTAYNLQQYGFDLDKYTADAMAVNKLPAAPQAQYASFAPIKMPEVAGPSGLGLMGGMLSAVGAGIGTGTALYGQLPGDWKG